MFNIGLPELIVIILIAVIFIDPGQLPGLFRNIGRGVSQVRRIRDEITREFGEVREELGLGEALSPEKDRPSRAGQSDRALREGGDQGSDSWTEGGGI